MALSGGQLVLQINVDAGNAKKEIEGLFKGIEKLMNNRSYQKYYDNAENTIEKMIEVYKRYNQAIETGSLEEQKKNMLDFYNYYQSLLKRFEVDSDGNKIDWNVEFNEKGIMEKITDLIPHMKKRLRNEFKLTDSDLLDADIFRSIGIMEQNLIANNSSIEEFFASLDSNVEEYLKLIGDMREKIVKTLSDKDMERLNIFDVEDLVDDKKFDNFLKEYSDKAKALEDVSNVIQNILKKINKGEQLKEDDFDFKIAYNYLDDEEGSFEDIGKFLEKKVEEINKGKEELEQAKKTIENLQRQIAEGVVGDEEYNRIKEELEKSNTAFASLQEKFNKQTKSLNYYTTAYKEALEEQQEKIETAKKELLRKSAETFEQTAVGLGADYYRRSESDDWGWYSEAEFVDDDIQRLYNSILEGTIDVATAINRMKTTYRDALGEMTDIGNGDSNVDISVLQGFDQQLTDVAKNSKKSLDDISSVKSKIEELKTAIEELKTVIDEGVNVKGITEGAMQPLQDAGANNQNLKETINTVEVVEQIMHAIVGLVDDKSNVSIDNVTALLDKISSVIGVMKRLAGETESNRMLNARDLINSIKSFGEIGKIDPPSIDQIQKFFEKLIELSKVENEVDAIGGTVEDIDMSWLQHFKDVDFSQFANLGKLKKESTNEFFSFIEKLQEIANDKRIDIEKLSQVINSLNFSNIQMPQNISGAVLTTISKFLKELADLPHVNVSNVLELLQHLDVSKFQSQTHDASRLDLSKLIDYIKKLQDISKKDTDINKLADTLRSLDEFLGADMSNFDIEKFNISQDATKNLESFIRKINNINLDKLKELKDLNFSNILGLSDFTENTSLSQNAIVNYARLFSDTIGKLTPKQIKPDQIIDMGSFESSIDRIVNEIKKLVSAFEELNGIKITNPIIGTDGKTTGFNIERISDEANILIKKLNEFINIFRKVKLPSNEINNSPVKNEIEELKNEQDELTDSIVETTEAYSKMMNTGFLARLKNVNKTQYDGKYNSEWRGLFESQEKAIEYGVNINKNGVNSNFAFILSEDENAFDILQKKADELKEHLSPVQDMVDRISSNSSLKSLNNSNRGDEDWYKRYADEYKRIDDRLGELNKKYELTNDELEEYVTLQIKAEKIMNEQIDHSGGVSGSGARNKAELKNWIERGFARDLGLDPDEIYNGLFGNITDALYDSGVGISLYDNNGKKQSIRDIVANILGYKSTNGFSGAYGAKEDTDTLKDVNTIISYIKNNIEDIKRADFSDQIKDVEDNVKWYKERFDETGEEKYERWLEEENNKLNELKEKQELILETRKKAELKNKPSELIKEDVGEELKEESQEVENYIETISNSLKGLSDAFKMEDVNINFAEKLKQEFEEVVNEIKKIVTAIEELNGIKISENFDEFGKTFSVDKIEEFGNGIFFDDLDAKLKEVLSNSEGYIDRLIEKFNELIDMFKIASNEIAIYDAEGVLDWAKNNDALYGDYDKKDKFIKKTKKQLYNAYDDMIEMEYIKKARIGMQGSFEEFKNDLLDGKKFEDDGVLDFLKERYKDSNDIFISHLLTSINNMEKAIIDVEKEKDDIFDKMKQSFFSNSERQIKVNAFEDIRDELINIKNAIPDGNIWNDFLNSDKIEGFSSSLENLLKIVDRIRESFDLMTGGQYYDVLKSWASSDSIMRETRGRDEGTPDMYVYDEYHDKYKKANKYKDAVHGELERWVFANSLTGKVSNSHIVEQPDHVSNETINLLYKKIKEKYGIDLIGDMFDTATHSHPIEKGSIGSDLTFSEGDIGWFWASFEEGIKKLQVESNGRVNSFDVSLLGKYAEDFLRNVYFDYEKGLDNAISGDYKVFDEKTGKKVTDYSLRAKDANKFLSEIIAENIKKINDENGTSFSIDPSDYLKQFDIEDFKMDSNGFRQTSDDLENLISNLRQLVELLKNIDFSDFKITGLEEIPKQVDRIVNGFKLLDDELEEINENTLSLGKLDKFFDFGKENINITTISQLKNILIDISNVLKDISNYSEVPELSDDELLKWADDNNNSNMVDKADNIKERIKSKEELIKRLKKANEDMGEFNIDEVVKEYNRQKRIDKQNQTNFMEGVSKDQFIDEQWKVFHKIKEDNINKIYKLEREIEDLNGSYDSEMYNIYSAFEEDFNSQKPINVILDNLNNISQAVESFTKLLPKDESTTLSSLFDDINIGNINEVTEAIRELIEVIAKLNNIEIKPIFDDAGNRTGIDIIRKGDERINEYKDRINDINKKYKTESVPFLDDDVNLLGDFDGEFAFLDAIPAEVLKRSEKIIENIRTGAISIEEATSLYEQSLREFYDLDLNPDILIKNIERFYGKFGDSLKNEIRDLFSKDSNSLNITEDIFNKMLESDKFKEDKLLAEQKNQVLDYFRRIAKDPDGGIAYDSRIQEELKGNYAKFARKIGGFKPEGSVTFMEIVEEMNEVLGTTFDLSSVQNAVESVSKVIDAKPMIDKDTIVSKIQEAMLRTREQMSADKNELTLADTLDKITDAKNRMEGADEAVIKTSERIVSSLVMQGEEAEYAADQFERLVEAKREAGVDTIEEAKKQLNEEQKKKEKKEAEQTKKDEEERIEEANKKRDPFEGLDYTVEVDVDDKIDNMGVILTKAKEAKKESEEVGRKLTKEEEQDVRFIEALNEAMKKGRVNARDYGEITKVTDRTYLNQTKSKKGEITGYNTDRYRTIFTPNGSYQFKYIEREADGENGIDEKRGWFIQNTQDDVINIENYVKKTQEAIKAEKELADLQKSLATGKISQDGYNKEFTAITARLERINEYRELLRADIESMDNIYKLVEGTLKEANDLYDARKTRYADEVEQVKKQQSDKDAKKAETDTNKKKSKYDKTIGEYKKASDEIVKLEKEIKENESKLAFNGISKEMSDDEINSIKTKISSIKALIEIRKEERREALKELRNNEDIEDIYNANDVLDIIKENNIQRNKNTAEIEKSFDENLRKYNQKQTIDAQNKNQLYEKTANELVNTNDKVYESYTKLQTATIEGKPNSDIIKMQNDIDKLLDKIVDLRETMDTIKDDGFISDEQIKKTESMIKTRMENAKKVSDEQIKEVNENIAKKQTEENDKNEKKRLKEKEDAYKRRVNELYNSEMEYAKITSKGLNKTSDDEQRLATLERRIQLLKKEIALKKQDAEFSLKTKDYRKDDLEKSALAISNARFKASNAKDKSDAKVAYKESLDDLKKYQEEYATLFKKLEFSTNKSEQDSLIDRMNQLEPLIKNAVDGVEYFGKFLKSDVEIANDLNNVFEKIDNSVSKVKTKAEILEEKKSSQLDKLAKNGTVTDAYGIFKDDNDKMLGQKDTKEIISKYMSALGYSSEISKFKVSGLNDAGIITGKDGFATFSGEVRNATGELVKFTIKYDELNDKMSVSTITEGLGLKFDFKDNLNGSADEVSEAIKRAGDLSKRINDLNNRYKDKFSGDDLASSSFSKDINEMIEDFGHLADGGKIQDFDKNLENLTEKLNNFQKKYKILDKQIRGESLEDGLFEKQKDVEKYLSKYAKDNNLGDINGDVKVNRLSNGIIQVTGYAKDFNSEVTKITANWSELTGRMSISTTDMGQQLSGLAGYMQTFGKRIVSLSQYWLAMYLDPMDFIRYISSMISTITELDTAMIDLQKTAKMSGAELNQVYDSSAEKASKFGITTQEYIQATADMSRAGFSTYKEATTMADATALFTAISPDVEASESATGLVSILRAFDIEAENIKDEVLSKINVIGNNFSTTNGEVLTGLEKSASSMSAANNSLEETIALFTASYIGSKLWQHNLKYIFNCVDYLKSYATT